MVTLDQAGGAAGWTRLYGPPERLAGVVELAWTQHVPEGVARSWRIVADIAPHMLAQGLRAGGVRVRIVGARARWTDVPARTRTWTAGVRLRPGALSQLTGLGASELTDRGVAATDVLGADGLELTERILGEAGPHGALGHIFAFLGERLRAAAPADTRIPALVSGLTRPRRGAPVREVAAELGMAERTLRTTCADHVGLAPVRIVRIARLHRVLVERLNRAENGWARLAARAGYSDQSHLIRDFRALLGEAPEAFVARGRSAASADSYNRDAREVVIMEAEPGTAERSRPWAGCRI